MIRTLLVDDDALTLELHRTYIERMEGFSVMGECASARAAAEVLSTAANIDLVLLDMTMPDGSGHDVLRHARARGITVDVIAVTGVRDAEAVQKMAALGVVQYLVKPVTFASFAQRLEQYRQYREQRALATGTTSQAEIDALLAASRPTGTIPLPKGLAQPSLERVTQLVRTSTGISAVEAAAELGMSRVSVRRYLEHLADDGLVIRAPRYHGRGRPETEYRWR